jgi:GDP-4-dehydro-6-deoxy-D-mannose reductase
MKVVVTGADGFVGGWLVRDLLRSGHQVVGGVRIGGSPPALLSEEERFRVQWLEFDLLASDSVTTLAKVTADAVVHLAAVASGTDARQDPGHAWTVNAAGTARLCEALVRDRQEGGSDPAPTFLLVSTGEVYGEGHGRPALETDPNRPRSPYAASKLGAEIAAREVADRTGLRVIIARAFPHTGPGQSEKYVVPALAQRMRTAKRIGAPVIKTGNLSPVRDLSDVRDVVRAYRLLVERGRPGECYNVATGTGVVLGAVVAQLSSLLEYRVIVEPDPNLLRANDLHYLVGDSSRLRRDVGWNPQISLDQTLRDVLDAQTY